MRLRMVGGQPAWLLCVVFVLLIVSPSPAGGSTAAVTIGTARFTGTWHEGWFGLWQTRVVRHLGRSDLEWKRVGDGSLHVAGTLSAAAPLLRVTLQTTAGKVVVTSEKPSVAAGSYAMTLPLQRPLPGVFALSASVLDSRGVTLSKVAQPLEFPAPAAGVVAKASVSATRDGPSVTVLRGRHEAWARFQFLTLPPKTRTVFVEWRRPDWVHVCQRRNGPVPNCRLKKEIAADGSVETFLRSPSAPLQRGRWYCQLSVGSTVARRTFVTIK